MDLSPLWISLRTALIATVFAVFIGIAAAYYVVRLGKILKGIADGILTLPMVLPPTVVGFFLLVFFGIHGPAGQFMMAAFNTRVVFSWYAPIIASTVVAFPLMYRSMRGAFEQFDKTLIYSAQTLGLRNTFIFWRIILPNCRYSIIAGTVLAFARALGEFGATIMLAGNLPGKTTTLSVAVYSAMAAGNNALAYKYVLINLAISFAVLLIVNMAADRPLKRRKKSLPVAKGGI
ncbi:MAG: molybdate ABC transporter permease subunit [Clostridiales bacterium]|nr:molybdate ABC transporter permease subunit [Clostridiales bacterium]